MTPLVAEVRRAIGALGGVGARVVVACSGGPDSVSLLAALAELRDALGCELLAAVVDHRLRPEAADEARAVVALAARLGVEGVALAVDVPRGAGGGASMAAARRARYDALLALARARAAPTLAVAHTASDQAETLVFRMLRGTGLTGLGAMAPVRVEAGVRLVRPLLGVTRAEVEAFLAARALPVFRDASNADPRYARSRLRAEVMPALRRERADADRVLAQLCARLRADDEALAAAADAALARWPDGAAPTGELRALPPAVRARLWPRAVGRELSARHQAALEALVAVDHGSRGVDLPRGRRVERVYGVLRWRAEPPPPPPPLDARLIDAPGDYAFAGSVVRVTPAALAALALPGAELVLRPPRPGDRLAGRARKLKRLLVDNKVPRQRRQALPILVRRPTLPASPNEEVVWVAGLWCVAAEGPLLIDGRRVQ